MIIKKRFIRYRLTQNKGKLTWMTKEELTSKKLAYNFDHDLPVFFDKNLSEHLLDGKIDQTY